MDAHALYHQPRGDGSVSIGVHDVQINPVAGPAGGHVEAVRCLHHIEGLRAGVMAVQGHDQRHRHHVRFAARDRNHDGVHLPTRAAEIRQSGNLEPIAVPFVDVQEPGVGDAGRPGREDLAPVAPRQGEVALRQRQRHIVAGRLLAHAPDARVVDLAGVHQSFPGPSRVLAIFDSPQR